MRLFSVTVFGNDQFQLHDIFGRVDHPSVFYRMAIFHIKFHRNLQLLPAAGLHDGGCLTAIAGQARVATTTSAFAFWCTGGTGVVTWGNPMCGGDNCRVQDQLKNVQQVSATFSAFAAVLADGTVVTWGDASRGGDSTQVADQLRNVWQIHGSHGAFAAILQAGTVVPW